MASGFNDWTQTFFTTIALESWRRSQPPEVTAREAAFLCDALSLGDAPQRLLDVPCGDGRHAVELAKLGHRVIAVDAAAENATLTAQRAAEAGVELEFLQADMRSLPPFEPVDAAYCMGNSFGYFPRAQTQHFLSQLGERLRPGARFVLDTASTAESVLVDLQQRSFLRVDEQLLLLIECDYDVVESRLELTYTSVLDDRVVDTRTAHHFVFTSGEIIAMLQRAGLETLAVLGDLDGALFEPGAERLLLIAER